MSPWVVCIRALMAAAVIVALMVLAFPENPLKPNSSFSVTDNG